MNHRGRPWTAQPSQREAIEQIGRPPSRKERLMPRVGRDRQARPLSAYLACGENVAKHPRPRPSETFKDFLVRLEGSSDSFLRMLIEEGYGEPSQREYLRRLGDISELLYHVRAVLEKAW